MIVDSINSEKSRARLPEHTWFFFLFNKTKQKLDKKRKKIL